MSRGGGGSDRVLAALLRRSHLAIPDDVPGMLRDEGRGIGALDVGLYLTDLEQDALHPVPDPDGPPRTSQLIDSSLGGLAYQRIAIEYAEPAAGEVHAWVPVVDGTERLGVLEVVLPADRAPDDDELQAFASLAAELVMTKSLYGDVFDKVRRTKPLSYAAELLWQLLPPLTFANERVVIAAAFAPPYDLGGDVFDYAVGPGRVQLAIFDAMGHGLQSGILATIALAAYRNNRRREVSLEETVQAIDVAIGDQYTDRSFATGVVTELDLASGRLRYCVAGHPRPLLVRGGRIDKELGGAANGGPLGLGRVGWEIAEEALQPGDRVVLFTDGVVEARSEDGTFLGDERFAEFIVGASEGGAPPPETLRRLLRTILQHQHGQLQDDATIVMLEWRGPGPERMTFQPSEHHAGSSPAISEADSARR